MSTDEHIPAGPPKLIDAYKDAIGPSGRVVDKGLVAAWIVVFALNLILPLELGWTVTRDSGRVGMFAGVIFLSALGTWVCIRHRDFGVALTIGGIIVAVSQFAPFFQFLAGMVALSFTALLGQVKLESLNEVTSEFGGLIATLITGVILNSLALGLGEFLQKLEVGILGDRSRKRRFNEDSNRIPRDEWELMQ